jgi:hypothetical protein
MSKFFSDIAKECLNEAASKNPAGQPRMLKGDLVVHKTDGKTCKSVVLMGFETFNRGDEIRTDSKGMVPAEDVIEVVRPKKVIASLVDWYYEDDAETTPLDRYAVLRLAVDAAFKGAFGFDAIWKK